MRVCVFYPVCTVGTRKTEHAQQRALTGLGADGKTVMILFHIV